MKESLLKRCELFIRNRNIIKENLPWESTYMYPLCASIFTERNMSIDIIHMKECRFLLKDKVNVFSNFRGISKMAVISLLTVDTNPDKKIENVLHVYELLKNEFFTSPYLPITAFVIANSVSPEQYKEIASRTRYIYNLMKKEHPLLTSREDSIYATLLALSDQKEERLITEIERCYDILKPKFFSGNAVQSLSHLLALGEGSATVKCRRFLDLYQALKTNGCKFGTNYELPILGVLSLLDIDIPTLIQDIAEVDRYLHNQKGFGAFGIGKKQRLMYAAMLIANEHFDLLPDQAMHMSAINGTITMVIAQQAAMCAAIAASTAAAASSSSS